MVKSIKSIISWTGMMLLVVSVTTACSEGQNPPQTTGGDQIAKNVNVTEFNKVMAEKEGVQIIDVRTPEEFAEGYIKGATLMNIFDSDFESKINTLDKNKPVAVYCRSGGRSGKAMKQLADKGFKEVYNLSGGFTAWSSSNMPSEK